MHFQSTACAAILHCSWWHSVLQAQSSMSSLKEADLEILLHTCINNNSIAVAAQELKHTLKHTTEASSSYSSLEGVVCCQSSEENILGLGGPSHSEYSNTWIIVCDQKDLDNRGSTVLNVHKLSSFS